MRVFKDNEELKSLIVDGNIIINDDIICNFNIDVKANINVYDIKANNIKAYDIDSYDINASNINARNINASNIKANDINANDISYYAFCVAYTSIECESIKGCRNNSFHKCLDGKLTIKEKLKEVIIKGSKIMLSLSEINELKKQLK